MELRETSNRAGNRVDGITRSLAVAVKLNLKLTLDRTPTPTVHTNISEFSSVSFMLRS